MDQRDGFLKIAGEIQNPYIQDWLKLGKKVIGYWCNYVPEEIIYAAGVLPFRMRAPGSTETTLGDSYLSSYNCSFTRHCLDLAFRGAFQFLEGIVSMNSCDHVRRLYDIWRKKIPIPFHHFMAVPHKIVDGAPQWYQREVINFKDRLEDHLGVKIGDESLRDTIKVYNEYRSLMKGLYELRKSQSPPVTGTEALAITVAATSMPKEQFNPMMRTFLDELKTKEVRRDYKARLMVVAQNLDEPSLMKIVEELGGLIVVDFSCFGSRMVWDLIDESLDPLEAISRRYLEQISCARMLGDHHRRMKFIKNLVEDFKVDGIICERLTFCDLWGGENEMLRREIKDDGIPSLILDREYQLSGIGQLKTRIQAFLEMIEE